MGDAEKPDDRSMLTEGRKTLGAMKELAPEQFNLYSKWAPQYAAVGGDSYSSALASLYPSMSGYVNDADSAYRRGMLGDIGNYGNAAYGAIKNLNPSQAGLMSGLSAQAQNELNDNGQLSAADRRALGSVGSSAGNARGNLAGASSVFNDYIGNESLIRGRQNDARNFASGVSAMENSMYSAPALSILTASSSVPGLASNAAMQSAYGNINANTYDPFNPYASDLYNTNYNAAWNQYYNDKNQLSSMIGGGVGMIGSIVGGAFGGPFGAQLGGKAGKGLGSGLTTFAQSI